MADIDEIKVDRFSSLDGNDTSYDAGRTIYSDPDERVIQFDSSVVNMIITDLGSERYRVTEPIYLHVGVEDDEQFVEVPELGLYADGQDMLDGKIELIRDIVSLCDTIYSLTPDQLGKDPKRWKAFLDSHIAVEA